MNQTPSNPTQEPPPLSNAFLVRCWQRGGTWHFMIEDVLTRERRVFVDVGEMVGWLTAVLDPTPTADNDKTEQKPKG